ncbi:MAG: hypothetical protein AW07_02818 [Candidatus Accumulibacter sp. SK-11]|nr:MAG: hypothetical protein AW07_02818 [Candidatus Accumulibacter sp. SK-11]
MSISIALQFVVVLAAIWMGARYSGVALGHLGGGRVVAAGRRFRRHADLATDRRHADHPRGDHGLVATGVAVGTGLLLARLMF